MPDVQSKWSQHFADNDLRKSIALDLSRTWPEHPFFAKESIQADMLHILFMWAKLNPDVSYRQGMNEVGQAASRPVRELLRQRWPLQLRCLACVFVLLP